MQPGHCFGAPNEASGLALRVELQTRPQTTFEVTPAIPLGIGWQEAMRFGRQVGLDSHLGIGCQVEVGFATQTRPETGVKVDFRVPFRVAVATTLGTVPGTVPTVVPGRSILVGSTAPNESLCGQLARFGLA